MNIILKALGNIDEKFIAEAEQALPKFNVKKLILPLVACFAIVFFGVFAWQTNEFNFESMIDKSTNEGVSESATTEGANEDKEFSKTTGICIVSGDNYLVLIDNCPVVMANYTGNENIFDDLQTGDLIEVEYGYVYETYPSQSGINSLKLLEKGSIEDIPQDVIDSLKELNWEID